MRPRVYDAEDIAQNYVRKFKKRPVTEEIDLPFQWPKTMQNVGDSLAVAYASDKWRDDGKLVLWKHIAESRNRALCVPGFLRDFDLPSARWRTIGPTVALADAPMPKHFAELGLLEEVDIALHTGGTNNAPEFDDDDDVVKVTVGKGLLGGSKIRWSEVGDRPDQPFLFVYTLADGPLMIIVGDELDIEADGIVG